MTEDDHDHRQLQDTLDQILAEQRKTNGRVGRLEDESRDHGRALFGDKRIEGDVGLVQQARDTAEVVKTVRVFIDVFKWAAAAFGLAAIGLAANLAQGLLG